MRVSQTWPIDILGQMIFLVMGGIQCVAACLAASLTSTQQVVGAAFPPSAVTTKTSPDMGGHSLGGGQMAPSWRTTGPGLVMAC